MSDKAGAWNRLALLLPPADAHEVQVCWDIGEQEAGLDLLIGALLKHQVALGETDRAEISVMTETWGIRESVASRLLDCPGDGLPAALELVEGPDTAPLSSPSLIDTQLAAFLVIPWIRCTASGRLLIRAHTEEPWGDLSYLPEHYAVLASEQGPSLQLFDSFGAWEALQELVRRPAPDGGRTPRNEERVAIWGVTSP
ncbi:hypothetical protein [Streptomyces sp. NPDC096339]|uniref:hypothetical protein n=1 Tax=Streptomyces sp. NPDC096339 TaxID=3366086 RepID=UPI0037FE4EFC